jgi:hypothetical protein
VESYSSPYRRLPALDNAAFTIGPGQILAGRGGNFSFLVSSGYGSAGDIPAIRCVSRKTSCESGGSLGVGGVGGIRRFGIPSG